MAKDREKGDWREEPSDLVKRFAELAPEGRALDLGMGEGRDALYLAGLGYQVTGVELRETAVDKCLQGAENLGLMIATEVADVRQYRIPKRRFAIIICNSLLPFLTKKQAEALVGGIAAGLKKGGLFICRCFTIDDPSFKAHQRKSREIAPGVFQDSGGKVYSFYGYGEILDLCRTLRPIYYQEYDYYDAKHRPPHWHGVVDYVGRKL